VNSQRIDAPSRPNLLGAGAALDEAQNLRSKGEAMGRS
jgi:hypothetical protein